MFFYENHRKFFPIMFPQCFATLSVVFIVEHLHHFLLNNRWRHYTSTICLKFHGIPKKNFLHPDSQSGLFDHCYCQFWFVLKKPSWYLSFFFQFFEILPPNTLWSANDGAVKTYQETAGSGTVPGGFPRGFQCYIIHGSHGRYDEKDCQITFVVLCTPRDTLERRLCNYFNSPVCTVGLEFYEIPKKVI